MAGGFGHLGVELRNDNGIVIHLVALLFLFGQSPDSLYREGVEAFEAGRVEAAIPLLERAAAMAKSNAQYWKAFGAALASRADYVDAVEPLQKACRLDRNLADACYFLGRALYAMDRYEAALEPLRQSLAVDEQKGRAETGIGQALEALGRNGEAEKMYRSAVGRNDGFVGKARVAFGRFLARGGRLDEALRVLEQAQAPESAEALMEYARALMESNRPEAAVVRLERLVQLTPNDAGARLLLAKAYRRLGRNADAVRQEQAGRAIQGSSMSK